MKHRRIGSELQLNAPVPPTCLLIVLKHREVENMKKHPANTYQPDICLSLTSEWLTQMMDSPETAIQWCQQASLAEEKSAFYVRHLKEQAVLSSSALLQQLKDEQAQRLRKKQEIDQFGQSITERTDALKRLPPEEQDIEPIKRDLSAYKIMATTYAAEEVNFLRQQKPITESLANKTTDKVKLQELRRLKVIDEKTPATLGTLTTELRKLEDTPRYYLLGVKAKTTASHAIAIVSTKSSWLFGSNGQLYYYDPNLHLMVIWNGRDELIGFLERSLLQDYQSVNHIWQMQRI